MKIPTLLIHTVWWRQQCRYCRKTNAYVNFCYVGVYWKIKHLLSVQIFSKQHQLLKIKIQKAPQLSKHFIILVSIFWHYFTFTVVESRVSMYSLLYFSDSFLSVFTMKSPPEYTAISLSNFSSLVTPGETPPHITNIWNRTAKLI